MNQCWLTFVWVNGDTFQQHCNRNKSIFSQENEYDFIAAHRRPFYSDPYVLIAYIYAIHTSIITQITLIHSMYPDVLLMVHIRALGICQFDEHYDTWYSEICLSYFDDFWKIVSPVDTKCTWGECNIYSVQFPVDINACGSLIYFCWLRLL